MESNGTRSTTRDELVEYAKLLYGLLNLQFS